MKGFVALFFITVGAHAALEANVKNELGLSSSLLLYSDTADEEWRRAYFKQEGSFLFLTSNDWSLKTGVRAWKNLAHETARHSQGEVDIRELVLDGRGERTYARIGVQGLSWGETFGLGFGDIIQSRNLKEYSPFDLAESKDSFFGILGGYGGEVLSLDAVFVPEGQLGNYPLTAVAPVNASEGDFFKNPEGGVKARVLLSGANIDVYAYRHLNRLPVLNPTATAMQSESLWSTGGSASWALNDIVFRGDFLATHNHPRILGASSSAASPDRAVFVTSTLGMDGTWEETTVGVSGQADRFPGFDRAFYSGSAFLKQSFFSEAFELEAQGLRGLTKQEAWFRVSGTYRSRDGLSVKLIGEFVQAGDHFVYALFEKNDRVLTEIGLVF